MIKIFGPDVSETKDSKPDSTGLTSGWFRGRDMLNLPTVIRCWWMNMIQSEILSALTACGVTPDEANDAQLGECFATKANRAGDTFTGPVTFEDGVIFDKDDVANIKFDEELPFYHRLSAFEGGGKYSSSDTQAPLYGIFGGAFFSEAGQSFIIPIPAFAKCTISRVRFFFLSPINTPNTAQMDIKVLRVDTNHSGTETECAIECASASIDVAPRFDNTTNWTWCGEGDPAFTPGYELDCGSTLENLSESDFGKQVFASVRATSIDATSARAFIGLKIEYKRTRLAV